MEDNQEIHKAFLSDLSALLKKYDASFNVDFRAYGWDSINVPTIEFNGSYEGDNKRNYSVLDLPSYID